MKEGYSPLPTSETSSPHRSIDIADSDVFYDDGRGTLSRRRSLRWWWLVLIVAAFAAGMLLPSPIHQIAVVGNTNTTSTTSDKLRYRLEDDILLITKIGSATLHDRLPIHLSFTSNFNTFAKKLFVSDHPATLGNITFFDALSTLSPALRGTPEFASLHEQLIDSAINGVPLEAKVGWELDKYKFLPMLQEGFRLHPSAKWVVVMEADTFLFLPQLVRYLSRLDHNQQYLLGHPTWTDYDGVSTEFVHGGSGFVLSSGLMNASFGLNPRFAEDNEELVKASAFGDAALSKALYDLPGVNLTGVSKESGKRFNSDPPEALKFEQGNWCKELLSFHHVSNADIARLYAVQDRFGEREVRWRDVWEELRPRFLRVATEEGMVERGAWEAFESWDSETTDSKVESKEECKQACAREVGCLMWEFRQESGACRWTKDFLRIGTSKKVDGLTTGWMTRNIQRWAEGRNCTAHEDEETL